MASTAYAKPLIVQTVETTLPKMSLSIPYVSEGSSKEANEKINQAIHHTVQAQVNEQGPLTDPRSEALGYFEVKNNQRDLFSLSIYNYTYQGGAHGMTLQNSLTMSQSTGRSYQLADLFKPGSDYVKRISEQVSLQIKERGIPLLQPFTAIKPNQDFYVADKSLVVYFQLYELAAYVYGFLYFPISLYSLQDIIPEDGPLSVMMASN